MSELTVGSLSGLAANSYVIDVAAGSTLDLSSGATLPSGSVLQVVSTTKTDTFSSSLGVGGEADITGLSVSITPSATTSKIFVTANVTGTGNGSLLGRGLGFILYRDATAVGVGDTAGSRTSASAGGLQPDNYSTVSSGMSYLDSPATTSATTYKVAIVNLDAGTRTVYVNRTNLDGTDAAQTGRFASTITVMEIAG